ncbi:hypothetical protein [Larkinella rosea]|uniref:Carboxypeptidase regulatory-like domain-containing protein n=1 Tax=Larkinella rosea TaxID=2025312 RepID=A0A3P1BD00_9BACT|nr:hypothetical protein [Larkinella rosea]RRA98987.1 hypothetical protein EHT25_28825 [Larkinella rosea]
MSENRLSIILKPAFLLLALSLFTACKTGERNKSFQGICGTVIFKSGNHMPGPSRPQPKGQPVVRDVLIYELTKIDQTEATDDGFYSKIKTKLVKQVKSGKDGQFCVSLPPGSYSVFVREEKGFYANLSDGQNNIYPVTVEKDRRSTITVDITYQAVF